MVKFLRTAVQYNTLIGGEWWHKGHIKIEDGVFLGCKTIIVQSVTIGKNSVIGAGSVVTKSIPENQVWCGNPAKYIKDRK